MKEQTILSFCNVSTMVPPPATAMLADGAADVKYVPTDRDKEATGAFAAPEEVAREQLQPCIISVEDHFLFAVRLAAAP